MKSLIIDNDPTDRNLIRGIMTNFGKCQMVTTGKIAIALVKKALKNSTHFDVITLNPELPDRAGIEVLMDIRSAEEEEVFKNTKRASIFMITAHWNKDMAVTAFSAGCDDYLLKPLDKEKVTKFLDEQIGLKKESAVKVKGGDQENPFSIIMDRFNSGKVDLPYTPQTSIQFNEAVKKDFGFKEVSNILKKNMSIAGKLISISNSAYYGAAVKSKNVEQTLARLGMVVTKQYVDAFCSRPLFGNKSKRYSTFLEELWVHSLNCAVIAEITTKVLNLTLQSDAFTNGLLHDIGKAVLLQSACELENRGRFTKNIDYDELLKFVDKYHNRVGSKVLKQWKFPFQTIHIALNHNKLESCSSISKELLVVDFANLFAKTMAVEGQPDQIEIALEDTKSASLLGITPDTIAEIEGKIDESLALYGSIN
jgi:HD-like signal output (HDOD) protein/ActR/RegA family two-component response regulator